MNYGGWFEKGGMRWNMSTKAGEGVYVEGDNHHKHQTNVCYFYSAKPRWLQVILEYDFSSTLNEDNMSILYFL